MIYLHDVNCLLDMIMNIYELIGFDMNIYEFISFDGHLISCHTFLNVGDHWSL